MMKRLSAFFSSLFPAHVKWYKSLAFLGVLGLTLIPLWDMGGIFAVMQTIGKKLVLEESSRLIEQTGNNVVQDIVTRSRQIEGLCRGLSSASESLPLDEGLFRSTIPIMIDFKGDPGVAGGGIWPEPGAFRPGVDRRSFFWGRDEKGSLKYYDDYNYGRGYHNDEWYPVVRYSRPGNCFWSRSYMDPYSYQPMVTCTIGIVRNGKLFGVSTIDLKLEGLHQFAADWQKRTGGYVFLLDRNNKFLSFPDPTLVRRTGRDEKGNRTEEFVSTAELAKTQPDFQPISDAVVQMNREILQSAKSSPRYDAALPAKIDRDSDQIDQEEAEFIAAVIADPLGDSARLFRSFEIANDFINKEKSTVFLFHVPQSYWKVVIVKPLSQSEAVAATITRVILSVIAGTILLGIAIAAVLSHRLLTKPLRETIDAVARIGSLVGAKKFGELEKNKVPAHRDDELGKLAGVINSLCMELGISYSSLVELNVNLENKVKERTHEIAVQSAALAEQNRRMFDSIEYAKRIQQAILPDLAAIRSQGIECFALFRPRDIVSGDFYWYHRHKDDVLAAVCDCTGHGVPGAFMSMIGHTLLNEIVIENRVFDPAIVLGSLHDQIRRSLRQQSGDSRDGMDVAFVHFNTAKQTLYFAGARRHLYVADASGLTEIKGGTKTIGGLQKESSRIFETKSAVLKPGSTLYLVTDGFADQPDPSGKKIGSAGLRFLLDEIRHRSMEEQEKALKDFLDNHRNGESQRDDITVFALMTPAG